MKILALLLTLALQPRPPREPMKVCSSCGTSNEPSRSSCINPDCRAPL